jgi:endonuclease YncB( thermonuclease family)
MGKRTRIILGLLCLHAMAAAGVAADKWSVFENAQLIDSDFNDGDSFHVRCGKTEYIFRLYFVDAPETSNEYPDRVSEQAQYFGMEPKAALKLGGAAARFTAGFLARGFTVYTRKEDARGNSERKRYFAMIKVGDRWLSDELVSRGLARIYGMATDLPDGSPARKVRADLKVLERAAQRNEEGGWQRSGK